MDCAGATLQCDRAFILSIRNIGGDMFELQVPLSGLPIRALQQVVRERWNMPIVEQRFLVNEREVDPIIDEDLTTALGTCDVEGKLEMTVVRVAVSEKWVEVARLQDVSVQLLLHLQRSGIRAASFSVCLWDTRFFIPPVAVPDALAKILKILGPACWVIYLEDGSTLSHVSTEDTDNGQHVTRYFSNVGTKCQAVPFAPDDLT